MKRVAVVFVSAVVLAVSLQAGGQGSPETPGTTPAKAAAADPRVGLKGGLRDAARAARHMELVTSLPKPRGFFDPAAPAGEPTPPERPESEAAAKRDPKPGEAPAAEPPGPP